MAAKKKRSHGKSGANLQSAMPLRASDEEWDRWKALADAAGLNLSAWIRARLNAVQR